MRLRRWLVYQRDTNKMVVLKIVLRDYPVASCPAISQNIYMYPRAGEVIETAGQLGSCPQKVLANDASFVCRMDTEPLPKERLNTRIDTSKKNDEYKKLTPQMNCGVRRMFNDRYFLIQ